MMTRNFKPVFARFGEHADRIICAILTTGSLLIALKPLSTQLWVYATFEFLENLIFGSLPPSKCSPHQNLHFVGTAAISIMPF